MKRGELAVKLERWEPLAPCAACFLLTAVLCGAQLFGGYAPFALGLVAAAGSGKRGLAALLGGVAGALVFLDFSHALRTLAVAVLLYTANNAFCETRWYRSRRFLPAMTALMYRGGACVSAAGGGGPGGAVPFEHCACRAGGGVRPRGA